MSNFNRFVNDQTEQIKVSNNIIIKLAYQIKPVTKKLETIW